MAKQEETLYSVTFLNRQNALAVGGTMGPFADRSEAERCATALAGREEVATVEITPVSESEVV